MAKQLNFSYNGKDYTLYFTRRTAIETEKALVHDEVGISKAEDASLSLMQALFNGAFLAQHRGTDKRLRDEMFEKLNLEDWGPALIEMYSDVYSGGEGAGEITLTKNW